MHYYAFGVWEEIELFAQGDRYPAVGPRLQWDMSDSEVHDFNPRFYTALRKSPFTKWEI